MLYRDPSKTKSGTVHPRDHLTVAEAERLMAAARRDNRHGHRDATAILMGWRHGLRAAADD